MATPLRHPGDPADIRRRVMLNREQRDWINAAAAALEAHADHDEDPLAMLEAAAELRRVVGGWDVASESTSADAVEPRLREALRQIAAAESGIWGGIARNALDHRQATSDERRRRRRASRRRDGDSRRRDRRPRAGRAGRPMTLERGPDGPPSLFEQAVIGALLRRPVRYLRELLAGAERRGQSDLAGLARQVLA